MTDEERAICAGLAGLLRAAAVLAVGGFAMTCLAALLLAFNAGALPGAAVAALGAVLFLGLVERYFAFRLRYDEALFDALARGTVVSLPALDHALAVLGLRKAQAGPTRPLGERVLGTRRLMRWHTFVLAGQGMLLLLALMTQEIP